MTLVAAAVCPHPPLLVPAVGRGIDLRSRAAAVEATRRLVAGEPDLVVLVGAGATAAQYGPDAVGSFARYGVDLAVPLGSSGRLDQPTLPLSLTVGAWLLGEAGWGGDRRAFGVPETMPQQDALALGERIAGLADRVALLCMGDSSARRTEKAPGWFDERAEPFDGAVADALRAGDPAGLTALDQDLALGVLAAGWTSWQVLAGAAHDRRWSAELLVDEAPFGVGYFVATWIATDVAPTLRA